MNNVFLLIGGNLGDREMNLLVARNDISNAIGNISQSSRIYETVAWGIKEQPDYLNQVVMVKSPLTAEEILKLLHQIEHRMGRTRSGKNSPRIIDIDILFFNDEIIYAPGLVIPHPEISNRRFTLIPLNEIASGYIHPVLKCTVNELLDRCTDMLDVHIFIHLSRAKP